MIYKNRAGTYVRQQSDYSAYIPKPLPPEPPLDIDAEMVSLLSMADRKLGRLDGITQILPNPELFVAMYVKKEAVLSSQIEGTQASLLDILNEDQFKGERKEKSVEEVVNYIKAVNHGLKRLKELPLCTRLIRGIHEVLLRGTRGNERNPGEFRKSQNWIGPAGSNLSSAIFIPPPVHEMLNAMSDLEGFFYEKDDLPVLVKIGLIHAQFETIHPFLDGNGRMGRLLITFWLCQQEVLSKPLLYLSYYFKKNRVEYYDRLMDIRLKGYWEEWLKFFLKGVSSVSDEAIETAKKILNMKEEDAKAISASVRNPSNGLKLLERLYEHPIVNIKKVAEFLDVSYPTANTLVGELCNIGILEQVAQSQRNKRYSYSKYIDVLQVGTEL